MGIQVVWFQAEDLRTSDHAPLTGAASVGATVCLWLGDNQSPDAMALDAALRALGARLLAVPLPLCDVLPALHAHHRVRAVWSHPVENAWLGGWAAQHRVVWKRMAHRKLPPPRAVQAPSTDALLPMPHGFLPDPAPKATP